jgi:hypothetical protein
MLDQMSEKYRCPGRMGLVQNPVRRRESALLR